MYLKAKKNPDNTFYLTIVDKKVKRNGSVCNRHIDSGVLLMAAMNGFFKNEYQRYEFSENSKPYTDYSDNFELYLGIRPDENVLVRIYPPLSRCPIIDSVVTPNEAIGYVQMWLNEML